MLERVIEDFELRGEVGVASSLGEGKLRSGRDGVKEEEDCGISPLG